MTARKPWAIDLFAGPGGMTQGLRDAGIRVLGAIEVDALAAETYLANHPRVRLWNRDIRTVSSRGFARRLGLRQGDLDLVAACPPCQGFSSMRTLNGSWEVRDKRNDLVFELARFAEYLLPRRVMMENVTGLAEDRRLNMLVRRLKRAGYTTEWRIVNVAGFGVPQRRRRLVLFGSLDGPVVFPSESEERATVRDAIGQLPPAGQSGDPLHDIGETRSHQVMARIRAIPKDGGSRSALDMRQALECHMNLEGFHDVYGRMSWDAPAPTLTGGCINPSKGRYLHPQEDRAITLREAALLQGFPADYEFSLSRGKFAVAEMIGNALPPSFVAAHATALISAR
jgi:DNA (cytosine-5)-methyltransferase 1